MTIKLTEEKLKSVVRDGVKEALSLELAKLRALFTPWISNQEQKDIEKRYGGPSRKSAKSFTINI